jgi:hypothetical protein
MTFYSFRLKNVVVIFADTICTLKMLFQCRITYFDSVKQAFIFKTTVDWFITMTNRRVLIGCSLIYCRFLQVRKTNYRCGTRILPIKEPLCSRLVNQSLGRGVSINLVSRVKFKIVRISVI